MKRLLSALVLCTTLPTAAHAAADFVSASYYVSSQSFYDIKVEALDFGRAWSLWKVLELQGRLGAFHSQGMRLDDDPSVGNPNSRTSGVTFGGAARIYAFQRRPVRVFLEGAVEILYTPGGEQFPAGGTGVNAFLRAGGGLQFQFTQRLALEAHYEYAHISNGAGSVEQNPMWNGRGGGLTLRHSF